MTTTATLAHHLQAILEANVDAILEDYTEESLLIVPQGTFHGRAAIRGFFDQFIGGAPPELIQALTLLHQEVVGDIAYITWKAEPFMTFGTDTFVIRDDRILVQTFATPA